MQRLLLATSTVLLIEAMAALGLSAQEPPAIGQGQTGRPAPTSSGVYLSAQDYRHAVLQHVVDCRTESHKIDVHDFLNKPYIDVDHQGQHLRHNKVDIFGFRDCNGHEVRFVQNHQYEIVEPGVIYVYSASGSVLQGKSLKIVLAYYFSTSPETAVLALTKDNLKHAYPENHHFHDALDLAFPNGEDASAYDRFHKTFRVNHLFAQSK